MPLDPAAQNLLTTLEQMGAPKLEESTPAEARLLFAAFREYEPPAPEMAKIEDLVLDDVPVRVYTPQRGDDSTPPFLVWFHGGGWVIGSVDDYEGVARRLADQTDAIVVSVDYRLAPEHKYPAAVDDCMAATRWVLEKGAELGGDPSRVAVGGDSAGGNLTAIVTQELRGRFAFQLLVYPSVDLGMRHPSIEENADGYLLTKANMTWFRDHYLGGTEGSVEDVRISPLLSTDWTGLPPALVITCEYDPLRDEGELYARKLEEAGVPVSHSRYAGMIHGFFGMSGLIPAADQAMAESAAAVRSALATKG
jgi:acetyl esterase